MNNDTDYGKEFEIARKAMDEAIKNCFAAYAKKLFSDAVKRGIAEAKAKK